MSLFKSLLMKSVLHRIKDLWVESESRVRSAGQTRDMSEQVVVFLFSLQPDQAAHLSHMYSLI